MRGDRSFEQQFRWEVDRWVFRYRLRGDPIEVTKEERDRLIYGHKQRQALGKRTAKLSVLGAFLFVFLFPTYGYLVPIAAWIGILFWVPIYYQWAYNDLTRHLRKRAPIGLRLGWLGQLAMRAESLSWRHLLAAITYLGLVSWMTASGIGGLRTAMGLAFIALDVVIGAILLWIVLMKWAQHEEVRLHDEKMDAIRRARELR